MERIKEIFLYLFFLSDSCGRLVSTIKKIWGIMFFFVFYTFVKIQERERRFIQ